MRIYIHGNCQATVLARMLSEIFPVSTIKGREVHLVKVPDEHSDVVEDVRNADIIICQPVKQGYKGVEWFSSDFIKGEKRLQAQFLTLSNAFFRGHHPEYFLLGDGDQRFQARFSPWHNLLLLE